jgi:nucleoside-diphosphate-sugar epimerase
MAQRVLLTGGFGRIGRRVLRMLLERGYEVRALVHRNRPDRPVHPRLELAPGDILDQEAMKRLVAGCDFVVHLAASWDMFPPAVYEKENNQLFESVIRGTYNLLEACYPVKELKAFLYASTDATYATGPRKFTVPITEDTELQPSRFYALAKIVGETMCRYYGKLYGLPWIAVRICWCLEAEELLHIFSYEFWEAMLSPEDRRRLAPLLAGGKGVFAPLMPDGSSVVDHVSDPEDIAQGIVLAVERHQAALGGIYNLAGPAPFRYLEVIEKLARDLGVPWGSAPVKGSEPYGLSIERARKVLGYEPQFPIERMLEKAAREQSGS